MIHNTTIFYQDYLSKTKEIQSRFLKYVERQDNIEENYENLINYLSDTKFLNNRDDFKIILRFISKFAKNHHREQDFVEKINNIVDYLKNEISKKLTDLEIFNIFKGNKLIILYLIENQILDFRSICLKIIFEKNNYQSFFQLEFNKLVKDGYCSSFQYNEIPKKHNIRRKIGENHHYISTLIRKDLIDEFISYVNQNDYSLNSIISPSIYETNKFLIDKTPTLIEYAAFFGSVQVFKYLYKNDVELTSSLWIYGIHSDNAEIINILEEENVLPSDKTYKQCLKESIKCHHIDMSNYIINNFLKENKKIDFDDNIYSYGFHYLNFSFLPTEVSNKFNVFYACKYDYFTLFQIFFNTTNIDLNETVILILFLQWNFIC